MVGMRSKSDLQNLRTDGTTGSTAFAIVWNPITFTSPGDPFAKAYRVAASQSGIVAMASTVEAEITQATDAPSPFMRWARM